ncbi:MAG: hypothetical protein AAFR31_10025 [Cyanobacteria bacterium J06627_8]
MTLVAHHVNVFETDGFRLRNGLYALDCDRHFNGLKLMHSFARTV